MKPNPLYSRQHKSFWAAVRTISQQIGYTQRGAKTVKVPTIQQMARAFRELRLDESQLIGFGNQPTNFANDLIGYFKHRADVLNNYVEPRLMNVDQARSCFEDLYNRLRPSCPLPMNKQKHEKKAPAYFTCIINMLIEYAIREYGYSCDYDPRELTTVTNNGLPLRTLSRRVDGAFPGPINPVSIWEIKEYYYTTTFGSRVADGVYETLLDGMELEELNEHEGLKVQHYLMIDAYYTWWECGRSYLCRIIDMLHMGYVDEVLFGYEVVERLPDIAETWLAEIRN